jgi:GT2 family glycosyltransferase
MLTYSVVICTLDRREELRNCIISWLKQRPLPLDIVVVHGRPDGTLEDTLREWLTGTSVALRYLRMPPSLVLQRNAGLKQAKGDVIFFADDDAVYHDNYAQAILDVYQTDQNGSIGGVQGTVGNKELTLAERFRLAKFFMLTRFGNGRLQLSAWPAFRWPDRNLMQVEVFSGAAMSYRKEVLQEFQFDEKLATYWVGDDFDMAYRVSKKFKLFQVLHARLSHYPSLLGRDGARQQNKMKVVNHFYFRSKYFGSNWISWLFWGWSEIGMWLAALLWLVTGHGTARFMGMIDGYRELLKNIFNAKL